MYDEATCACQGAALELELHCVRVYGPSVLHHTPQSLQREAGQLITRYVLARGGGHVDVAATILQKIVDYHRAAKLLTYLEVNL